MKTCRRCGETKPRESFYRCAQRPDGLQSYCKPCSLEERCIYRATHPHDKERNSRVSSEWNKANPDARKATFRKYLRANRHKANARAAAHRAVKAGKLLRKPCEECGDLKTDAHHDDYSKPLEVRWLCKRHHYKAHTKTKIAI